MAFIKGAFWGVVIGGAGAVTASLLAPPPVGSQPPAAPQIAAGDDLAQATEVPMAPDMPTAAIDTAPASPQAAPIKAPPPLPNVPQTDTASADQPRVETGTATPDIPTAIALSEPRPEAEAPVLPNPQSLAPQMPEPETDIIVQTEPATPVEVATPATQDTAQVVVVTEAPTETVDQIEAVTGDPVAVRDPSAPASTVASTDVGVSPAVDPVELPDVAIDVTPNIDLPEALESLVTPDTGLVTATPDTTAAADVSNGADEPSAISSETADTAATSSNRPAVVAIIDTPSSGLPGGSSGVTVRRPGATLVDPEAVPEPEVTDALDDATPALVRYGAFFDNPEGLPLMSVLLIDDGSLSDGVRALSEVPFPVTVALDPAQSGAAERMAAYADAGIEIAALAAVPSGATPSDVAVAMEGTFNALPRAIALVDPGTGGLPAGAETVSQVVADLATAGRGLVVPEGGLNSALRAAEASDVHAATIYRDLDNNDQDARVIRRFIDQAAFRARQETGVVLLARLRPETVSALLLWGEAKRAGQVALAPLSATLLAQ